jgi:hypothetical protein
VPDGGAAAAGGGPGTATPENNCGLQRFTLERVPPEILLVLDRSTSMNASVPGTQNSRWTETTAALSDVLAKTNDRVMWGLKMFPSGMNCGVTDALEVSIAAGSAATVNDAIGANRPGGVSGTPTPMALQRATAYLSGRKTHNPKFIVLATDGEPDCGGQADAAALEAVTAARTAGFPVFVVGIATAGTTAHGLLTAMAAFGGQPRPGDVKYYPVAVRDDLVGALGQITTQVASCVFPLDKQPPSPDDVAVKVDGVKVDRDRAQARGWSYGPNMKSIELYGPVCEQLKGGQIKDVNIIFGCPGVVIE